MKTSPRWTAALCALALLAGSLPEALAQEGSLDRVLVFSKTAGFRHASIEPGAAAIKALGEAHGFAVDHTEDAGAFTANNLQRYDAVVFLSTTGDILNEAQEEALEAYVQGGGGWVGIHAAADTEYEWPWYGGLVGGYFESHPPGTPEATIIVADRVHPATRHLPTRWTRVDEWYNYQQNPRGSVHVLATLDTGSYEGSEMGHDHPIVWAHEYDGGRAFYTGLGHTSESFSEEPFLRQILGALRWASGAEDADVNATVTGAYEREVLLEDVTNPIELAVDDAGNVFFVERGGAIRVWEPETGAARTVGFIHVNTTHEDGMMGLTLDPAFGTNGWMYVFYSPAGDEPVQHLSRFTYRDGQVDLGSERLLLEVPVQREECCHTGGSLAFGPDGHLFLSTGDDTNPFASDGYTPIDERPGREPWDAQRSSANTHDLRGKILRITPQADGTYAIPEGNLFADPSEGRPEIYTMGHRNPYRISVDSETGYLYWGEIGPDAGADSDERGPMGHDEWNQARAAGNFGWPLFVGDNKPYRDWDFAAEEAGRVFDPEAPLNTSPNNTGARELPPAQPAFIWYPYGPSPEFPELVAGSRSAMAGPVVRYDEGTVGPNGLPAYFDNTLLIYEWARNWIKEVKLDDEGNVLKINDLFPDMTFYRPMDLELGPDGSLYLLEFGTAFWGDERARLSRIKYQGTTQRPPAVALDADVTNGPVPLTVNFEASAEARNPDATLSYAWDFDGDGTTDTRGWPAPNHTYERPGTYVATLTVTDSEGLSTTKAVTITAGNTAPLVEVVYPVEGGFFSYDQPIRYEVAVTDPEDGAVTVSDVVVEPSLGRDTHELPAVAVSGSEGTLILPTKRNYYPAYDEYGRIRARYVDAGGLEGEAVVTLQPKRLQAEFADSLASVARKSEGDVRNPDDYFHFLTAEDGGYAIYEPINLYNIESMTFHVRPAEGGTIEARLGGVDGPLLASVEVPAAGTPAAAAAAAGAVDVTELDAVMHNEGGAADPVGTWDYVITTPGGEMTGMFTITEQMNGTIRPAQAPADVPITDLAVDGEAVTFKFDAGDYGIITVDGTVASDVIRGSMSVGDMEIPMRATREGAEAAAPEDPWVNLTVPVQDPGGTHALYLVFRGTGEALFDLDWIEFNGAGIASR